mgnify:CR=1 FL=1
MSYLRVIRVLEFIGPAEWIATTLEHSWLPADGSKPPQLDPLKSAREIVRVSEAYLSPGKKPDSDIPR